MDYATSREIRLHDSIVKHLIHQTMRHETEPDTSQVLSIYNTWPGKHLCASIEDVTWVVNFIRHVFTVSRTLWREALWIDGYIEEDDVYD